MKSFKMQLKIALLFDRQLKIIHFYYDDWHRMNIIDLYFSRAQILKHPIYYLQ